MAKKHLRKALYSFARCLFAGVMAIPLFVFFPLATKLSVVLALLIILVLLVIVCIMTWQLLTFFENISKW